MFVISCKVINNQINVSKLDSISIETLLYFEHKFNKTVYWFTSKRLTFYKRIKSAVSYYIL